MFGSVPPRFGLLTLVAAVLFTAFLPPVFAQTVLPEVRIEGRRDAPLNSDARVESASRLGMTARETPATVEVIDRTTLEAAGLGGRDGGR